MNRYVINVLDESIRSELRGMSLKGYVIFYRFLDGDIEILRVLNGRRNFPSLFV